MVVTLGDERCGERTLSLPARTQLWYVSSLFSFAQKLDLSASFFGLLALWAFGGHTQPSHRTPSSATSWLFDFGEVIYLREGPVSSSQNGIMGIYEHL